MAGSKHPAGVLKERIKAHPEDYIMAKFNKLYIIKQILLKEEKLKEAQLQMAKQQQV